MRNRNYHKKQSVKYGSEYHWRLYQASRNRVNIEIRKSKSRYYCQKIGECDKNDPKSTWKLINSLIGGASKTKHVNDDEMMLMINDDEMNASMKIYLKLLMNYLLILGLN